jgi:MFS family permease
LMVLWLALLLAYADRQILSLMVEPIRKDLHLSLTQIGLLQGLAFGLCYAFAGIPLARLIDRRHRVSITSSCVLIWSIATVACGFALSFPGLLAARTATAVAEAGINPAGLSIITDLVPRKTLGRASAIFLTAPFVGSGMALLLGGALFRLLTLQHLAGSALFGLAPWQAVFVIVGLPGILVAALLLLTVREPTRSVSSSNEGTFRSVLKDHGKFLSLYLGACTLLVTVLYTQMAWIPAHFGRTFSLPPETVGRLTGPTYLIFGVLGSLMAGLLSAKSAKEEVLRRILGIIMAGSAFLIAPVLLTPLLANQTLAVVAFAACVFITTAALALTPVPLLLTIPSHCRAQVLVIASLLFAIIGAGLGPITVGAMADHLFSGNHALGYAIALVSGLAATGALTLMIILRRAPIIERTSPSIPASHPAT